MVTFDAGQTLITLDLDFLSTRLVERGVCVAPDALAAAEGPAWESFDRLVASGHDRLWHALMAALLGKAGVAGAQVPVLVDWLWTEQPRANLWRRPWPGMIELARELRARGVKVGVISNSEGKLAELFREIGIADAFATVVDSGAVGIDKPDRRIFDLALERLDAAPGSRAIHIGDSWAADVEGALGAGWQPVWFGPRTHPVDDPRVAVARDAQELADQLRRLIS